MESQERNYCVMECDEEELNESQKIFYSSKLNDFNELIQSVIQANSNAVPDFHDVGALTVPTKPSVKPLTLCDLLSQTPNTPTTRPLVVLDPATLNQLVSSSSSQRVASTNQNTQAKASGHSLPAVAPDVRMAPGRAVTMLTTNPERLTLSGLLNDSSQPPLRQSPRMRFPSASHQTVRFLQTPCPPTHIQPSVKVRGPSAPSLTNSTPVLPRPPPPGHHQLTSATIQLPSRPPPPGYPHGQTAAVQLPPRPVPSYSYLKIKAPSPNTNGISFPTGPRVRLPAAPKVEEKEHPVQSNGKMPLENVDVSSDSALQSSPVLPLLPETRPETANDSRPRPRPGPASRTQRLPLVPSPPSATSEMVDLTVDDQPPPTKKATTKEKTFPSLIVTARASLKIFPTALVNNERLLMDNQIRKVMQMTPAKFTEYLLQQRLLKSDQICKGHHKPLKLGIYSDPHRFPVSGGYVWIADCCKSGFCSVFAGSIFDKTLQPPTNIIKLMYHWACNTAVHNVLNWVKVDSYVMKTFNTYFRAVCSAVVHQKFNSLGGPSKKIQVGVISIGTFPDGETKEVKVDIMAVMDPDIPSIRLKVLENFLSDSNKVYESKFRKILEVLRDWVHRESIIITDFAVDLSLCREYGFSNLIVSGGRHALNNNNAVMDYLRGKIPVMFQNTLGLLSYAIIQQFLDELVWREAWGPFPSRAFESMVEHMAELTKLPGPDLISKLKKIATDPAQDWKYSVWQDEHVPESMGSVKKVSDSIPEPESKVHINKEMPLKEMSTESTSRAITAFDPAVPLDLVPLSEGKDATRKIFLEPFYYGVVDGDPSRQKPTGSFLAECAMCKRDFLSTNSFTNHLIHHALNDNSSIAKCFPEQLMNVCSCCGHIVKDLDRHRKEKHPYTSTAQKSYMCKICRIDYQEEEKLVKHMHLIHQELDMPYRCDMCDFQTSIFDFALSHFKDFHDKDYCVRCPYCFKTVRFGTKGGIEIPKNQYYFVQHVQKHSLSKLNRKCEKCVLSFTNMATLKQHQEKVHKRSGRFLKNVRRSKLDISRMVVMSLPTQAPLPPVTLHENSFHTLKGKALSSSVVVPEYYAVCSCLECDGPMTQNHFSVKMTCTRCSFQSCCANSIREHSARFHQSSDNPSEKNSLRRQMIGGSAFLNKHLYCANCMFESSDGNKIASHLARCGDGRSSATCNKRKLELWNNL